MNPNIKDKWVEALCSGKYKQGVHTLRNKKDEYCCLGVLCDITNPKEWSDSTIMPLQYYRMQGEGGQLPTKIMNEVGLTLQDCKTLVNLNDGGRSFSEIADYIETNL